MNYLSVENISKSFGERVLFKDISFGINKDQKIAFIAKNGSGKTTIMNIINGFDGDMLLALAPEGTRSPVEFWKSGFYHIAKAADVGIVLGFLDYKTKTGGLGPVIDPSLGAKHVMDEARKFYAGKGGKFPENESPIRLREEETEAQTTEG